MLVSQIRHRDGRTRVVVRDGPEAYLVRSVDGVGALALAAAAAGETLAQRAGALGFDEAVDLREAFDQGRVLAPLRPVGPAPAAAVGLRPALAGLRAVAADGTPVPIGCALAFVAPGDAAAPCAVGPEVLAGGPPAGLSGAVRLLRGGRALWERPFRPDAADRPRAAADRHRLRPGDLLVHLLALEKAAPAGGADAAPGDLFEFEAPEFGLPLRCPPVGEPRRDGMAVAAGAL
ncbi:hypothetical protein [Azospirillum sp. ST 5-10]|uniref:hypothetical protein n=1 Tax=unclassified Azospirillum TaxID=2630922 RepID=UPI003F4A118D